MTKFSNVSVYKDATLSLMQCRDGLWLYDETRGMNLAIRAKTEQSAFVSALHYYQERLKTVETELRALESKVTAFVESVSSEEDEL